MNSPSSLPSPLTIRGFPGHIIPSRHPSSEEESGALKRPRASRPKVKSGCITCKIRRVKCDEAKPHCLRCQRSGRTCDGYASTQRPPRALAQIKPRASVTNLHQPSVSIHVTDNESRYFQVFADRAAHELSGYFDSQFWFNIVLQESHNVTAIRHATIALGALNESLTRAPTSQRRVNVIQDFEKRHHEQAVLYYLRSIRTLNEYISESPQLRTALIACALFICFETIQGSLASSIQQTCGGLSLLRSYNEGKAKAKAQAGGAPSSAEIGRQALENLEDTQSATRTSLQIKKHFDGGPIWEEPAPSMSHQEAQILNANTPGQLSVSTENNRFKEFNLLSIAEDEDLSRPWVDSGQDTFETRRDDLPNPTLSTNWSGVPQAQRVRTTSIAEPHADLEGPRITSRSSFSLEDNSSAYSSDSSNYREPVPINIRRKSRLSSALSHMPNDDSDTLLPKAGSQIAVDNPPEESIPSAKRPRSTKQILQRSVDVEDAIIQSFARLDAPGLFFGIPPVIPIIIWDINETWHLPIPAAFPSFISAQRCWDFLMDRSMQFYRKTFFHRVYSPQNQESDELIAKQYEGFIEQIADFERAFKPMLDEAVLPDGGVAHAPSLVVSLYNKCTAIMLAQTTTPNEMIYDNFLPSFKYIVRTCSLLVAAEDKLQAQQLRNRRFSFNHGIIAPLHLAAAKCRDPLVRREAADLLFASPRQEGLWDSLLTAKIAKWVIACEEEALGFPSVEKDDGRIEDQPGNDTKRRGSKFGKGIDSSPPKPMKGVAQRREGRKGRKNSRAENLPVIGMLRQEGDSPSTTVSHAKKSLPEGIHERTSKEFPETKGKAREEGSSPTLEGRNENEEPRDLKLIVPESKRVQVTAVSFFIPSRYVEVRCKRAVADADGKREEREVIIAW